jgi:putative ABC transport system permease protein
MGLVDDITFGTKQFVGVLMGGAGFVLLLACANVANLLLARVTGRQKEIAVRLALGAGRWQIVRQLIVESTLVSVWGGLAGMLLAGWDLDLTQKTIPPFILQHIPGLKHLQADWRVLVFTIGVALLAGILVAVAPALHVSRPDLNEVLKESARGGAASPSRHRLRSLLVVTEIALALVLLVSAGLMVTGFRNLANENLGFDRNHVLTFRISLAESKYSDAERIRGYYEQLIQKLQSLPSVESAAAVTAVPGGWWGWNSTPYSAEGQAPEALGEIRSAGAQTVTPEFFRALRMPLLKGRFISAQDGAAAPLVVNLSEGLARHIWPHEDAVGKRVRFGRPENNEPWRTVVGVVGSVRTPWDKQVDLTVYFPVAQRPQASMGVVVRTSGDPLALAAAVRSQALELDSQQPPYDLRSLAQLLSDDVSGVDYSARTMIGFGILALILAAAGIFAVMAYSVLERTHEIGLRMALGARRADVLRLVMGNATKLAALGLGLGVAGALALTRLLTSLLLGVVRMDLLTFAGLTALLAAVAALAAYVPASWAAKVEPMEALRYE